MTSDLPAPWDVVIVPFPFADLRGVKRRPALALSSTEFVRQSGTLVAAMITSDTDSRWPGDVAIRDLAAAGLRRNCVVRWKLFTVTTRVVLARVGHLASVDRRRVREEMVRTIAPEP